MSLAVVPAWLPASTISPYQAIFPACDRKPEVLNRKSVRKSVTVYFFWLRKSVTEIGDSLLFLADVIVVPTGGAGIE